jgi:hypothetical protein
VEKILVKKITTNKLVELDNLNNDSENSIKIDIFFRFEVSELEKKLDSPELSNDINNQKNTPKDVNLDVSGRKRGTRTHNPALPKRVR